jgi:hypothetical protein
MFIRAPQWIPWLGANRFAKLGHGVALTICQWFFYEGEPGKQQQAHAINAWAFICAGLAVLITTN